MRTGDTRSEDTITNDHGSAKHGSKEQEELGELALLELGLEPRCPEKAIAWQL